MRDLAIDTARVFLPLLAPARYKGAWGGRGSGKSHFFAELLIEDHIRNPGMRSVCIREVQKTLKESSKRLIEDKLLALGIGEADGFKVFNEVVQAPGDGLITFIGMQDHSAESIKSLEGYRRAWVEEAQSLSARSLQLLRPTLRADDSQLWFSWNPRRKTDAVDMMLRGQTLPTGAVVAGNVETSMCVTNAIFGALGLMAASQCTMNNFTFGNARHQYYETISGGTGAGVWTDVEGRVSGGFDGTSVVQAHMTNSRLTDPEVLEFRFPVRLDSYEIRAGSGGAGRWRGGDGGVRRVRFLEPMTASILSNGRRVPAFGLAGGAPGALGVNRVERADSRVEALGHIGSAETGPGDAFVIETPGGGG